ncbi:MAG: hypothetical protein V7L20_01100 [Nostoc sp.]|uniref:hypothetical protein n=1 Tax=Nostoc sp. TaxID=1180 RepID=UPI002FF6B610
MMANSTFNLSDINGTNGFAINGMYIPTNDRLGFSVSSAGDINGDGFDDLIIGKYDPNPFFFDYLVLKPSQSYVVFGSKGGFSAQLNVSTLNGTNGFVINAINPGDFLGYSVSSAGDINGDGLDDLILGAFRANGESGQSYVVFGSKSGFDAQLNVSNLNGTNGFAINGTNNNLSDQLGFSVSSAGDINGDGIDDLIIGADRAPNGNRSGQSYVVFGSKSGFGASFDISTLNGTNGFAINGINSGDFSGRSVSSAGDINGDGIDDVIIGASGASPNGQSSGQSYVVFGSKSSFDASFDLSTLNGTNGFAINGINSADSSGFSVSNAGDINGDGIDDVIIGTFDASPNGIIGSGQSYVVFGSKSGFDASFDLSTLNGTNGFAINGINSGDTSGFSVSNAGDVNGDGIDDLIIGAYRASPNGITASGQSYVVFGSKSGFDAQLNLSTLNGTNGFAINGIDEFNNSGRSVSNAGDVNGDGIDDLIIGAPNAAANGIIGSGQSYVVFGGKNIGTGSTVNLTGTADADTLIGTIGNNIIDGKAGNDTLTGNGGQDKFVFHSGDRNDIISDFGGVGKGSNPSSAVIANVDTLQFIGSGLTARNLQLTQNGNNLEVTFENVANTKIQLQNFLLENLDNLLAISSKSGLGNILFDGQTSITDSFDVINANSTQTSIFNKNTVTFLNDLNNNITGFDNSNDVINGQGGNDKINGLSGNDLLRGGTGNDILIGGAGNDTLVGGAGADKFLYNTNAPFASSAVGVDVIADFNHCQGDKIILDKTTFNAFPLRVAVGIASGPGTGFSNKSDFQVTNSAATSTAKIVYDPVSGQLFYNQNGSVAGFGSGGLFATLTGAPTLAASDFVLQA